jgi:hypothetical protein
MPRQIEKRQKIEDRLIEYIRATLSTVEAQGRLDHFDISISVHQGTLSYNLNLKEREKIT